MKIYEIKNRLAKRAQHSVQADGRAAPLFQGFSAKSGFARWAFLLNPALAANASR